MNHDLYLYVYIFLLHGMYKYTFQVYTIQWNDVGLMVGQRRRRWSEVKRALIQYTVFVKLSVSLSEVNRIRLYCIIAAP